MNKIYIAGKITGTNDYMERFSKAERFLRNNGFEAINPAQISSALPPESTSYEDYIKLGLTLLDSCRSVYMLTDWKQSNGALLEFQYAKALGYNILYEEDFYDTDESNEAK